MTALKDPKIKLKIGDLETYFKNSPVWERLDSRTGHRKVRHVVTKVMIEYQAHSHKLDKVVKKDIQKQIHDQVQTHLNILCNDIFGYTVGNWKQEPNFDQSLQNYIAWSSRRNGIGSE